MAARLVYLVIILSSICLVPYTALAGGAVFCWVLDTRGDGVFIWGAISWASATVYIAHLVGKWVTKENRTSE